MFLLLLVVNIDGSNKLVLQHFEDPLSASGLLPSQAVSAIFGNVREIIGINRELMSHLSTKNIGEAFLLLGPFLKLYSTYANNHEHALAALMVCSLSLFVNSCHISHSRFPRIYAYCHYYWAASHELIA